MNTEDCYPVIDGLCWNSPMPTGTWTPEPSVTPHPMPTGTWPPETVQPVTPDPPTLADTGMEPTGLLSIALLVIAVGAALKWRPRHG